MAMAGPSLATQRKNKPTTTPSGTTLIVEQDDNIFLSSTLSLTDGSSSSSPSVPGNPAGGTVAVATVYRRFCGTSPFDKHWLNLDCCGLICAALTYMLHLYGIWAVCTVLLPPWMSHFETDGTRRMSMSGSLHCLVFSFVSIMACISHFNAMTTDPGAVPPDAKPLRLELQLDEEEQQLQPAIIHSPGRSNNNNKRTCRRCNSFKPTRAHHCSICRRCIIKMDHHCPWVNNCVGIGNHKYFLLFLFYTFLSCMYSSTLLIVRFFVCMKMAGHHRGTSPFHDNDNNDRCLNDPRDLLPLVGLAVECMLFGLFTSCMIIDQWDVVLSNVTNIDRLKGEYHYAALSDPTGKNDTPRLKGIHEVFGPAAGFQLNWLAPFVKVTFPSSVRDEIMGFCTPCANYYKRDSDDGLEMRTKASRTALNEIV